MQEQTVRRINLKIPMYFLTAGLMILLFFVFGSARADAKTITIRTPEQLKNINWVNKGFGPGNTYVIGNDMTLGEQDDSTCLLTKGKFVIDFNGHTVQNAAPSLTVFKVSGADVTMMDSKASSSKPSVRSYGQGAVQITAGKLTIKNGYYLGASNGQNNPVALHAGGGTCIVNGGTFQGDYAGASHANAALHINGGTFRGGFPFAFFSMGDGSIKIVKANFIAGSTNYGYTFPLGKYCYQQTYDFSQWFAKGYSTTAYQNAYWNMQSQASYQPFLGSVYAVTYTGTNQFAVTTKGVAPAKITSLSIGHTGSNMLVKWNKTARTTGYQVQYATNSSFKGAKTITVKSAKTLSTTVKGIKANTMYYVRVRSCRAYNGGMFYSGWTIGAYNPTTPNITSLKNTASGVSMTYRKVKGVGAYRIFRRAGKGKWVKLADVKTNSYLDRTAKKGVTYQYELRGMTTNGKLYVTRLCPVKTIKRK